MAVGAWICLLAPLAGALLITLAGTRISRRAAGLVSTLSVAVAFGGALTAFFALLGRGAEKRAESTTAWTWLSAGEFQAGLTLLVDPLSVLMALIVSGVGTLIVAYSIGYMHGAVEERRYFAYMALFVFSMLLLVLGGNFLLLLAGWGLVALSSYLLIGFEHERPSAVAAAKKAFVMNAFGDAAFALALFVLIFRTGTLDFGGAFAALDDMSSTAVNLVALGLLAGAVAKSAQIPLHTWLPDAMEGPTPVSALIHAATMVTAGVYLIVRAHPVFEAAPAISGLAAGLGAVTLLAAGLIALVQTDIKRVIAYSTMSQIGYMFLAAGIGAYASAMFHLMTHAFFKALLFLAAGIVIHALVGQQDMRQMGGLGRYMPMTRIAFWIGALALAAIPPFSGFFSKDSILASALAEGGYGVALLVAGLVGTFLTAVYTFRMLFLVFGGEPSPFVREHYHAHGGKEGPFSMTAPVATLGVLAVIGGWIQVAGLWHPLSDFLDPITIVDREHLSLMEPTLTQDLVVAAISLALSLAGIALAWLLWSARRARVPEAAAARRTLEQRLYFDWLYDRVFYAPAVAVANAWRRYVEDPVIGGSIDGIAGGARGLGGRVGQAQTGLLRTYALAIALGAALLTLVFLSAR
ncbi:MAG TPA: NADH-quinone oxidoreductase subunit L [Gaiellaceae bacterium]|nr:NADH-quinone oxidoreductase subunit L [Gaiellaceae bacterium]